jgi:ribonuclease HI
LQSLFVEARRLAEDFEQVRFTQVPREENRRADALANQAMNTQGRVADPARAAAQQPAVETTVPAEASAATGPDPAGTVQG